MRAFRRHQDRVIWSSDEKDTTSRSEGETKGWLKHENTHAMVWLYLAHSSSSHFFATTTWMSEPKKLQKPISSPLLIFVDKRKKRGPFEKGELMEAKRVFSWLHRGKPLGFLNPRAQLSLGKGRRWKKKRRLSISSSI